MRDPPVVVGVKDLVREVQQFILPEPARSIAVARRGPNGLKLEKESPPGIV